MRIGEDNEVQMFYAMYKDQNGNQYGDLWTNWDLFNKATPSPECEVINIIDFTVTGETYQERKDCIEELSRRFWAENDDLSWAELGIITAWFAREGEKYGLLSF